ncbi:hypothetical protein DH2020_042839 [Rehmannia glutinosa]|uniref:Uncharacterized protein n=1 Tax=Rehmannia glutinosa TaxID=99300 RepID=A0ABR0UN12_REHGL
MIFPSVPSAAPPAHLLNAHHQCVVTLETQNSYTSSLVFTGKFLYTGSSDKEIRLYKCNYAINSLPNYENINTVMAGKGAVKALVASSDKLISAHQDNKIRVWKIDHINNHKITKIATLPTLTDRAFKLLVPKNHIQITRHKKCTFVHHVDTVSALALSSDESLLYSVSWDRTLKIWQTTDFQCLQSVANAHDDAINVIALSEDGHVYTGSSDKKIKVWKQKSGEKTHSLVDTLEKHNSGVNALALSKDGTVLYSGASDRSLIVWTNVGGGGMEVVGALRGTLSLYCVWLLYQSWCAVVRLIKR